MKASFRILTLTLLCGCTVFQSPDRGPERWTPAAIATGGYEATPSFSPDGQEMIYLSADRGFEAWRLLRSTCVDGAWSPPAPPPFAAPAGVIEADPGFTPDGRGLYFISARHDPANADFDIYHVARRADGAWGKSERLPEPVNSAEAELLPRADAGRRLYFGSARSGGLGKSDIYVAKRDAAKGWSVDNLGPPVNSPANEYEAEISRDGQTLIVVSDRDGRSHLYRFVRVGDLWVEAGRVPAREDVFQVGPGLSPRGEKLLFAQADEDRSGEIFLTELKPDSAEPWPPKC
jgi:Tol biopolymer transport system component